MSGGACRNLQADAEERGHQYTGLEEEMEKAEVVRLVEEHLQEMEFAGTLTLETSSVYGAVVAIPQIARCMDWNLTLSLLAFESVMILAINYFMQVSAIILIGEASQVIDVLAGKMHLCDFGKDLGSCPNASGCVGPGGTSIEAKRLYAFDIWAVRNYVRQALVDLFPDLQDEIMNRVDPGEYGLESYRGRLLACFLFMLVEVRDFFKIYDFAKLLWHLPTQAEEWISLSTESLKVSGDSNRLESLRFQVAGMPMYWKVTNVVIVILPKVFLWYSVCWIGVRWLMETSGILNAILGAITMDFVLTFDELLYDSLANPAIKYIMNQIGDYALPHPAAGSDTNSRRKRCLRYAMLALPRRLILTLGLLATYIGRYYVLNCKQLEDGTWVSKDMHMPKSSYFSLMEFLTNSVRQDADPYWTMPGERPG